MTIAERDYPVARPRPAARAAPANSQCGKRKINIANSFALLSDVRVWARRVVISARAGWPVGPGRAPRRLACRGRRPPAPGGGPVWVGASSGWRRPWGDRPAVKGLPETLD